MTPGYTYAAQVVRVIDGDTLDVAVDVGFRLTYRTPLRIAHVNAPELATPEGVAARLYVVDMLGPLPTAVTVQTFKPYDKYGRYLADVTLPDGRDVGASLLATGHAQPYL